MRKRGSSDVVLRIIKKLIISGFVGVGQRMTIQVELFVMVGINFAVILHALIDMYIIRALLLILCIHTCN